MNQIKVIRSIKEYKEYVKKCEMDHMKRFGNKHNFNIAYILKGKPDPLKWYIDDFYSKGIYIVKFNDESYGKIANKETTTENKS